MAAAGITSGSVSGHRDGAAAAGTTAAGTTGGEAEAYCCAAAAVAAEGEQMCFPYSTRQVIASTESAVELQPELLSSSDAHFRARCAW
jgi:hypothetical protein